MTGLFNGSMWSDVSERGKHDMSLYPFRSNWFLGIFFYLWAVGSLMVTISIIFILMAGFRSIILGTVATVLFVGAFGAGVYLGVYLNQSKWSESLSKCPQGSWRETCNLEETECSDTGMRSFCQTKDFYGYYHKDSSLEWPAGQMPPSVVNNDGKLEVQSSITNQPQ